MDMNEVKDTEYEQPTEMECEDLRKSFDDGVSIKVIDDNEVRIVKPQFELETTILKSFLEEDMTYQQVADKHKISRGKVWRTVRKYDCMRTKRILLDNLSSHYTDFWACPRPMGSYKGRYPKTFLKRLQEIAPFEGKKVLHLFSGSLPIVEDDGHGGCQHTADIKEGNNPTYYCNILEGVPAKDSSYDIVIADPPYDYDTKAATVTYSKKLYGTGVVKPYSFIGEACRLVKPGGYLGVLHQLVYFNPESCESRKWLDARGDWERKATIALTTGPNMRARVCNVFKKEEKLDNRHDPHEATASSMSKENLFNLTDKEKATAVKRLRDTVRITGSQEFIDSWLYRHTGSSSGPDHTQDYSDAQDDGHEYQWREILEVATHLENNDYDNFERCFLRLDSVPIRVILDSQPLLFKKATQKEKEDLYIDYKL
jgi:hypothetical protein